MLTSIEQKVSHLAFFMPWIIIVREVICITAFWSFNQYTNVGF